MQLDTEKINAIDDELRNRIHQTRKSIEQHLIDDRAGDYQEQLTKLEDRLAALGRIVTRNIAFLPRVRRKVFVSTPFLMGEPDPWVMGVLESINESRMDKNVGIYDWVFGTAEPVKNYRTYILSKIVECHYFLSIVVDPSTYDHGPDDEKWPVRPWLLEEIGAASPLPKLTVIAVENGVDATAIGRLFGLEVRRVTFDRDNEDGRHLFARQLETALSQVAIEQVDDMHERLQMLKMLVG